MLRNIQGDRDYSKIMVFQTSSPKINHFCLGAKLQRKSDKTWDTVSKFFYENSTLSNPRSPVPIALFRSVVNLIDKRKFYIAISTSRNELKVSISAK